MRHLVQVNVRGLLGRFNHELAFPEEWEFVIVHGPNGVGKTKFLELVDAVGNDQLHRLTRLPFETAEFQFSDQSTIKIVWSDLMGPSLPIEEVEPPERHLVVELTQPSGAFQFQVDRSVTAIEHIRPARLRLLEQELPLDRMEQDLWYDQSRDDYLTLQEIVYRYSNSDAVAALGIVGSPPEFKTFLEDFKVHLIETQRLIRVSPISQRGTPRRTEPSTVLRYARDLTEKLSAALADNSQTSQQLDRTFPKRLLDEDPSEGITDEQIRDRYRAQSELREELAEISVLEALAEDISLPDRDLQGWERRVLWTYLEDAEEKLATFRGLLERVQLLRRIVNSRFLFQNLIIDRELGFRFVTENGEVIGADSLSSGEQHELVLVYDLLFNVSPETTVLVDEPELSLHVSWQQQFLDDMVEISRLASLRFIVATHSPQIIHTWSDRMVPLGEPGLKAGPSDA